MHDMDLRLSDSPLKLPAYKLEAGKILMGYDEKD
jgi:hypothetical protein